MGEIIIPKCFSQRSNSAEIEELIEHDPKGPPIDAFGVALPLDHLAKMSGEISKISKEKRDGQDVLKNMCQEDHIQDVELEMIKMIKMVWLIKMIIVVMMITMMILIMISSSTAMGCGGNFKIGNL